MERCEGGRKGLRIAAARPVLLGLHAGMVCYFPLGSQEVQPLSSPQLPTQFRTAFFSGVPLTCLVGDSIGTSGIVCDGVQMLLGRDGGNLLRQRHRRHMVAVRDTANKPPPAPSDCFPTLVSKD